MSRWINRDFLPALAAGAAQGVTFNWADDALRAMGLDEAARGMAQLQDEQPFAFGAGNLAASLVPSSVLGRAFVKGADAGLPFLSRAMGVDSALGGAYGLGGYEVEDKPLAERLSEGAIGAAAGGLTAGLVPVAYHNARQLDAALPALLRGEPPKNAAMALEMASGRAPGSVLDEALARDAAIARGDGSGRSIFAPFGETNMRPVDVDGANTRGLFDVAMRDPGARGIYRDATAETFRGDVLDTLSRARKRGMPKGESSALPKAKEAREALKGVDPDLRADLLAALDDVEAHGEWVRAAKRLFRDKPEAAAAFARQVIERVQRRATGAAQLETLTALRARVGKAGDLTEKLEALGVGLGRSPRRGDAAERDLVRLQGRREREGFSNASDRLTARTTPKTRPVGRKETEAADERLRTGEQEPAGFRPADAQELMQLMTAGRRLNYVSPSRSSEPLLDAVAQPGVRWANPFAVDPKIAMSAFTAGKGVPVLIEQGRSESGGAPGAVWDEIDRLRRRTFGSRRAA